MKPATPTGAEYWKAEKADKNEPSCDCFLIRQELGGNFREQQR